MLRQAVFIPMCLTFITRQAVHV